MLHCDECVAAHGHVTSTGRPETSDVRSEWRPRMARHRSRNSSPTCVRPTGRFEMAEHVEKSAVVRRQAFPASTAFGDCVLIG